MGNFQYTFQSEGTDNLIEINFNQQKVEVYMDPFGRSSSSQPDYELPFNGFGAHPILATKIKPTLEAAVYNELVFLVNHYSNGTNFPEGKRLFFFNTSCAYSKSKEKMNFKVGIGLLISGLLVAAYFFGPLLFKSSSAESQALDLNTLRLPAFICLICFSFFIILTRMYFSRIKTAGFSVLGTEKGLVVFENNAPALYAWDAFTKKYEVLKDENAFILELKAVKSTYSKYGSNKANKELVFAGLSNYDYYLKIILSRIK